MNVEQEFGLCSQSLLAAARARLIQAPVLKLDSVGSALQVVHADHLLRQRLRRRTN
jgi:hypothetical protein